MIAPTESDILSARAITLIDRLDGLKRQLREPVPMGTWRRLAEAARDLGLTMDALRNIDRAAHDEIVQSRYDALDRLAEAMGNANG